MKPYVICDMNASVDGRILGSRWRSAENRMAGLFERLHDQLGGGSWLIGRVSQPALWRPRHWLIPHRDNQSIVELFRSGDVAAPDHDMAEHFHSLPIGATDAASSAPQAEHSWRAGLTR
jgi:hypothetical protein